MSLNTVQQFAKATKKPVEDLLEEMRKAGLPHTSADDQVTPEHRQALVAHLGLGGAGAPRARTRQRLDSGGAGGPGKKIKVLVKKKKPTVIERPGPARGAGVAKPVSKLQPPPSRDAPQPKVTPPLQPEPKPEPKKKAEEAKQPSPAVPEPPLPKELTAPKPKEEVGKPASPRKRPGPSGPPKSPAPGRPAPRTGDDDRKRGRPTGSRRKREQFENIQPLQQYQSLMDRAQEKEERERELRRRAKPKPVRLDHNPHTFSKPQSKRQLEIKVPERISVSRLAHIMTLKVPRVVEVLNALGSEADSDDSIDQETALLVVEELGHRGVPVQERSQDPWSPAAEDESRLNPRSPVVTVMGHVDHGKTTLLDYIRSSQVAEVEQGGITQHIGAYHVDTSKGRITFLDTPGHAAFSAMRRRGANSTDIVILVVAADDGVQPQTEEAIGHLQEAGVPVVVALSKMDRPGVDESRIRNDLAARGLAPEDWGGDVQFVPISAKTGQGVDALLEAVLLQAELLDLKAVPVGNARGVVIESRLDKGRGPVASILVQSGCLKTGSLLVAGRQYGRIRAMTDADGAMMREAGPSIPVEVQGLKGVPEVGDPCMVVSNEKQAKEAVDAVQPLEQVAEELPAEEVDPEARLEELFSQLNKEEKILHLVLRTDVQGSLEALLEALQGLDKNFGEEEVRLDIVASGVGAVTESDVELAAVSGAWIVGFNVRCPGPVKALLEQRGLRFSSYGIIYELLDEVERRLTEMVGPKITEAVVAKVEVRDVFGSSAGPVAGCFVAEGVVRMGAKVRITRAGAEVAVTRVTSLRRHKDSVSEVRNGMECGITAKDYNDIQVGDLMELIEEREVPAGE